MHYRSLGKSGLVVSEVGMGCNRLGEPQEPDAFWVSLVHEAIDRGVTIFDTSESYGWGRSEEILGQAVGARSDVLIATKVSRVRETKSQDFTSKRIVTRLEQSLIRLRREHVDVFQLHSPSLDQLRTADWHQALSNLKQSGKIRLIGVSINDAASGQWLIENRLVDVLQVPYNLLEPGVGDAVFPLAEQAGVGILVRVPMAQGILTGKFRPGDAVSPDHRAKLAGDRMERLIQSAEGIRSLSDGTGLTPGQFALRFCLSSSAVSAVIPGARSVDQLGQNVEASNGTGLDGDQLARVEAILRAT